MAGIEFLNGADSGGTTSGGSTGGKTNIKKLFKNKYFLVAAGGVVVAGLYALSKKGSTDSAVAIQDGYATATQGLTPETSDTAYTSDTFDAINSAFLNIAENMQGAYNQQYDSMSAQLNSMNEKYNGIANIVDSQSLELQKQNDINTMMNNSDNYLYATTSARKEALHNANAAIASKWGFVFDDDTGYWYDSNGKNIVYSTATQDANKNNVITVDSRPASNAPTSSGSASSGSNVSNDIAVMKSNSAQYNSATSAQKEALHNSNVAIANKNGWSYNDSTGSYYDKSGKKVY